MVPGKSFEVKSPVGILAKRMVARSVCMRERGTGRHRRRARGSLSIGGSEAEMRSLKLLFSMYKVSATQDEYVLDMCCL